MVALGDGVQHFRGAAGGLHHDRDGSLFAVVTRDGDRYALALLVQPEDHELAGLRVAGDERRLDLKEANGLRVVEETLGHYFVHVPPLMFILYFALSQPSFSISSSSSPKRESAELTGSGVDISTPAIFSRPIGSVLPPPERNFL